MHAAVRRSELLREGAVVVIHVPVPGFRQGQALRGLEAQGIDVGEEDQQAGELLPAFDDCRIPPPA